MRTDFISAESGLLGELTNKRIAFVGKLGGVNRREAHRLVRQSSAIPVDADDDHVDIIVIGADELPLDNESLLDARSRELAARDRIEIISETQLWNRLGMVEHTTNVRRLYTPAMLAHLLDVPVSIIRRWHRRGLIVPVREVHRLPYFDFQEVATARRLAELLSAGASPAAIEHKLEQLAKYVPDVERPLAQLSVIVEGRQLLLRQGEGLIEPGGQMRIDFEASAGQTQPATSLDDEPSVLRMTDVWAEEIPILSVNEMLSLAIEMEDAGQIDDAIEMYRAVLVAGEPKAEINFRLAELLYLKADIGAARERYSMAVELNEDYVEARANLGCVLAETGETELAVAAFRGALRFHPDYPDVHYHMARLLDDLGQPDEAITHWRSFLQLAPDNPWADEARARLGISEIL